MFASNREGTWGLFWRAADGTGEVERFLAREGASYLAPLSSNRLASVGSMVPASRRRVRSARFEELRRLVPTE